GAHGATLSIAHWQPRVLRVVVANLPVEGDDFDAAAKGTPRVTLGRLVALDEALREARRATQEAKRSGNPTLLVLPEISVPRRLERTLVRHAATEGISLIAGLEYRRSGAVVFNEAIGVFPQGFDKTFPVTWTKLHPASNERRLLGGHGVQLSAVGAPVDRLVVETSHGRIGVLICSEILEASALADLSGRIELLVVPAWNDDTGTFEHLTHAASSMLVHSFVAVANNAGASDSRIVAPVGQPRHLREWTRIIHRGHSRVVWGDLPTGLLRAVHDGKRDASEGGDMKSPSFRPLPPGWRQ
ncbi:MAG: hypothetical protein KBB95_18280, partial [Deltaproteobacteria bacterium]|nr:hypothetical protein [Deltaproteobacteria bacterium]